jgi:hypothetical protein
MRYIESQNILRAEMHQGPELLSPTLDEPDICEKLLGPFARVAEGLWRAGLVPIPVGGEDGKKPLVHQFHKMEAPSRPKHHSEVDR